MDVKDEETQILGFQDFFQFRFLGCPFLASLKQFSEYTTVSIFSTRQSKFPQKSS